MNLEYPSGVERVLSEAGLAWSSYIQEDGVGENDFGGGSEIHDRFERSTTWFLYLTLANFI